MAQKDIPLRNMVFHSHDFSRFPHGNSLSMRGNAQKRCEDLPVKNKINQKSALKIPSVLPVAGWSSCIDKLQQVWIDTLSIEDVLNIHLCELLMRHWSKTRIERTQNEFLILSPLTIRVQWEMGPSKIYLSTIAIFHCCCWCCCCCCCCRKGNFPLISVDEETHASVDMASKYPMNYCIYIL